MPKRTILLLPICLLLLLGCQLTACDLTATDPRLAAEGVDRREAVIVAGGQPQTLDPALTYSGPYGPLGHIFSGLVMLDKDLQVQPDLAAGWQVSDDGLTYTFYLNEGTAFHDGRPITAEDIIFSWERATDPALGSDTARSYLGDIAGVEERLQGQTDQISGLRALDDHTLEVRLSEPVIPFLAKLAYPVAFVVDANNVAVADWERQPNGSGPFKLQTWKDDDLLVLARNENYYRQPAAIAHLVYDLSPGSSLAKFEKGEIDLVGIDPDTLTRLQDPNYPLSGTLQTVVDMCTSTIGLNNQRAPFDDMRVRQAFSYALDKERLRSTFGHGSVLPAYGPLPPGMPGFGSVDAERYPYDPQEARRLLAEAGYEDPADLGQLIFLTSGYGDVGPYVTAIITLWQETLGVDIQPRILDPFTYNEQLYEENEGHFYASGWCADYPDPQNFLEILYHSASDQNLSGFSDAAIDALLDEARSEKDVAQRLALYQEAERLLVEAAPVIFTTYGVSAVLVNPDLQNYVLTPIGVPQWHRVEIKRGP